MSLSERTGQFGGIGSAISMMDAVYRWCECLKGHEVLENALKAIGDGVGAEALSVSRVRHGAMRSAKLLPFDRLPRSSTLPHLSRSFANSLLGDFMESARPGTVWLRSAIEVEADPALELFHSRRRMQELAVITLATDQASSDFLEMHFAEPLAPGQHALLNSLAQTLSEAWRNRTDGLFIASVLDKEEANVQPASEADILGHRNPARLSRAEYRVCLLLSRGLQLEAVCSELAIAKSTLRTHLRNIYAKTATENMPELLYVLLRNPKQSVAVPKRRIA